MVRIPLVIAEVFLGAFEEDFKVLDDFDLFDFLPSGGAEDEVGGGTKTEVLDTVVFCGFSDDTTLLLPPSERKGCESICWVRETSSVAFL